MSLLKPLWRYLLSMPLLAAAGGLLRLRYSLTLDQRLVEIRSHAEAQIRALGFVLSLEVAIDATTVASDSSASLY